jgi:hypothetical protein
MKIECKNCRHAVDYQKVADPTDILTICEIIEDVGEYDDNNVSAPVAFIVDGLVFSNCIHFKPREET